MEEFRHSSCRTTGSSASDTAPGNAPGIPPGIAAGTAPGAAPGNDPGIPQGIAPGTPDIAAGIAPHIAPGIAPSIAGMLGTPGNDPGGASRRRLDGPLTVHFNGSQCACKLPLLGRTLRQGQLASNRPCRHRHKLLWAVGAPHGPQHQEETGTGCNWLQSRGLPMNMERLDALQLTVRPSPQPMPAGPGMLMPGGEKHSSVASWQAQTFICAGLSQAWLSQGRSQGWHAQGSRRIPPGT